MIERTHEPIIWEKVGKILKSATFEIFSLSIWPAPLVKISGRGLFPDPQEIGEESSPQNVSQDMETNPLSHISGACDNLAANTSYAAWPGAHPRKHGFTNDKRCDTLVVWL